MGWWGSRRPASVAFSQETPSDGVSTGSGPGSEGTRGRRNSLDRPNSGLSATRKNPEDEANALLRAQFLHHLVTQVKLSSVTPLLLFARSADTTTVPGFLNLVAAVACVLVICLALLFKARTHLPRWARVNHDAAIVCLKRLDYLSLTTISMAALGNIVLNPGVNGLDGSTPAERVAAYYASAHLAIGTKWIVTQVPARMVMVPELLRNLVCMSLSLMYVRVLQPDGCTPAFCAALLARGLGAALAVPCAVHLCHNPLFKEEHLPVGMQLCPSALRPLMELVMRGYIAIKTQLGPAPLIGFLSLLSIHACAATLSVHLGLYGIFQITQIITLCVLTFVVVLVVARLHVSNASLLRLLEKRLGVASSSALGLGTRLGGAVSEHDVLRVASEALHALFPNATSHAIGTLSDAKLGEVSILEVAAISDSERVGLLGALPRTLPLVQLEDDDGDPLPGCMLAEGLNSDTSVAFVCGHPPERGAVVADSTDWPEGVQAFTDWASAEANGCGGGQFVTARLMSGGATVGFAVLHFRGSRSFSSGNQEAPETLRQFCVSVGDAVLARRAKDAAELALRLAKETESQALSLSNLARDIYPDHLVAALEARARRREVSISGATPRLSVPPRLSMAMSSRSRLVSADGARSSAGTIVDDSTSDLLNSDLASDLLSDSYANVTILFADIVTWTAIASELQPEQAMQLLDRLFQRFDTLTTAQGVYKVETIGDSYMCVAGMLPVREDHARAALRLGLDMHAAAASVDIGDGRRLQVRVGIHSGPVTSGIVGHVRARFCLFGDTVNVSSRMESSGRAGCVQLSAAAYQATGLPPGLVSQRLVDVKGKGQMETFVLDAGSPEAAQVRALLDSATFPDAGIAEHAEAAPADANADAIDEADDEDNGDTGDDDAATELPVLVSRTVAIEAEAPKAASQSAPSSSGRGSQDVDAAVRLREASISHFLAQVCISIAPTMLYILLAATDARIVLFARVGLVFIACVAGAFTGRAALPPAVRHAFAPLWAHVAVWMQAVVMWSAEATLLLDFLRLAGPETCPDERPSSCVRVYFWIMHAPLMGIGWLTSQLPVTRVFFPETIRNLLYVAFALRFAYNDGVLTPWYAVFVAMEGMVCAFCTPIVLLLCYRAPESVLAVLSGVETCPRMLRGYRSFCHSVGLSLRRRFLGDAVLLDARTTIVITGYCFLLCHGLFLSSSPISCVDAYSALRQLLLVLIIVNVGSKLKVGPLFDLDALADEVKTAERTHLLSQLRDRLAVAPSEAAILRAGCEALSDLFPGGIAYAMAAFAESSSCAVVTMVHLQGEASAQEALLSSLPSNVGAMTQTTDGAVTSVARACQEAYGRPNVLDSRELPGGIIACSDWETATNAGLKSVHAVTAPLNAGHVVVGFMQVHFGERGRLTLVNGALLRELCDAVGGAIFVRRAFAINRDAFASGMRAAGVPSASAAQEPRQLHPDAPFPASEADARALAELDERAEADNATLQRWELDSWDMEDAEVQRLCCAMLHSFGLLRRFRISPSALASFVFDVATHYNDNPFHCYRHAFQVMHVCWLFLCDTSVRKKQLQELDALALLLAALTHDLEHPGLTNAYQVNTASALALRYNDASVLENHHCSCAFASFERAGILKGLEPADLKALRKLVVASILATDMVVHKDLLARVTAQVNGDAESSTAGFSRELPEHRELLVSFLLHAADLCCPLFPPAMSRRIADSLSTEFERQAGLERAEALPVTVPVAKDEGAKGRMELGFIDFVVRPLYLTLAIVAPGLGPRCLSLIESNRRAWSEIVTVNGSETSSRRSG